MARDPRDGQGRAGEPRMVTERFHGPLTRDDERAMRFYYVIYSIDVTNDGRYLLNHMDPNIIGNERSAPEDLRGCWDQTEGDEQYDFDYLADEIDERECRTCGGDGAQSPWENRPGY